MAIGTHLTKTECVLVRFRIANGHKLVQHAFCQGLVHVFGDWNDGHSSVKVAKIPLHFPVERRRAREAEAAKQGIGFYIPRRGPSGTPSALPRSSKLRRRSISPPFLLQVGSFLLGSFVGQAMEVACMQRKLSAANQQSEPHGFGNHSVTECVRPQALSATSQMDAWGSTIRDLADGRLASTIRDLADGRWGTIRDLADGRRHKEWKTHA